VISALAGARSEERIYKSQYTTGLYFCTAALRAAWSDRPRAQGALVLNLKMSVVFLSSSYKTNPTKKSD
jgi:hypothetical protein